MRSVVAVGAPLLGVDHALARAAIPRVAEQLIGAGARVISAADAGADFLRNPSFLDLSQIFLNDELREVDSCGG